MPKYNREKFTCSSYVSRTLSKDYRILDWTLERYRSISQRNKIQQQNEQDLVIINRIREELDEKRKIARNNLSQSELIDEVEMYRLEETTIEDVLNEIGEFVHSR